MVNFLLVGKQYTVASINLIRQYGTNTLSLDPSSDQGRQLLAWVTNQKGGSFFSWLPLPSFRSVKIANHSRHDDQSSWDGDRDITQESQGSQWMEFQAAAGSTSFFYQGVLFVLEREGDGATAEHQSYSGRES